MEPSRPNNLAAGALLLLCMATAPAVQAATGSHHTLAQLVQQSDATVLGHTLGHGSFWDHGRIVTRVKVQVDEVWQGGLHPGETMDVYTLGGEVGEIGQRVDGAAALPSYGRVVLHLRRVQRGYVPTGMAQGVWNVDALYGSDVFVHRQATQVLGLPDAARALSQALPTTLAALRAAVQEASVARP